MRRRLRLIGITTLLGGLLLSAGTACGSDDPEKAAPPSTPATGSPAAAPTSAVPSPGTSAPESSAPANGSAPQGGGLQPLVGRWDYFDKKVNKTFSLFIAADGGVRSLEPGERNNNGRIVATGPRTFRLYPETAQRKAARPADVSLSPDGKSLTVTIEGETVTFTRAG